MVLDTAESIFQTNQAAEVLQAIHSYICYGFDAKRRKPPAESRFESDSDSSSDI